MILGLVWNVSDSGTHRYWWSSHGVVGIPTGQGFGGMF